MPILPRRRHLALLATVLAAPRPGGAQGSADRPLRLVVPFPAGGATDALARLLAPALSAALAGQNLVVENRTGGGGIPAADHVAKSAPDGLTLLVATSSIHSTQPAVNPATLPFDPERDFTPIGLIAVSPSLLLVSAQVPARTLPEFVAWAKARPGGVNYGSSGVGTIPHLNAALFDALAGTGMVHIPYRGTGPVYAELRRGEVHMLMDVPSTAAPHLQAGAVRALGHTSATAETPLAPGVPSLEAAGLPGGMVSETWFGLFAPAGLPAPAVRRLAEATRAALADPALQARFLSIGAEVRAEGGPEALARMAREERTRWVEAIRRYGVKVAE
jgi:tripartite-type tricarboxylate transporter receptor subunit TctC